MPPLGPFFQLSIQHTEKIKVTQSPLKCASMLGHRLRVVKIRILINQSINQSTSLAMYHALVWENSFGRHCHCPFL